MILEIYSSLYLSSSTGRSNRPAEVGKLSFALQTNENVFGLQISVDDFVRVAVLHRVGHFVYNCRSAELAQPTLLHQLLIQFT